MDELWVPPGHFYSPIIDRDEVLADAARIWPDDRNDCPGVDVGIERQLALLDELEPYLAEMPFDWHEKEGLRYWFANEWFPVTSGVFTYLMLRHLRPARYIEVGSGFSSALALDVNDQFFDGAMRCTFIEPNPERLEGLLRESDRDVVSIVRQRVQAVDLALFDELGPNDVLFVDSAHVAKTGSDVNFLMFDVLPRLREGVVIHFHDVFEGFEYPRDWVDQARSWNEAYLLRAFLQFNDSFEIVLWDSALAEAGVDIEARFPPALVQGIGAIWLRRTKGPRARQ
jgi:predicted O-methyltransferase YrrM